MNQHISDRITKEGPKRILALDGGGIRGALSLGFLKKLEKTLRQRYQKADYRLCEYFDLITGTSTGSIIAAGLAMGMTVDEITYKYVSLGKEVFGEPRGILKYTPIRRAKHEAKRLETELDKIFGDTKLGSAKLKTGLIILLKD